MDTLRQDLVYACRVLARKPGFTAIAALTLALGIAANTTIFSLVSGVLLRPLPFPDPDRLVRLWTSYPVASNSEPDVFSSPNYLDLAARARTLAAVGAYSEASLTVTGTARPESIEGIRMTASMARVLGVNPQLGRWFTEREDTSAAPVLVISDAFWHSRFNGDPGVLGQTVNLSGKPHAVIGVLPRGVGFPTLRTQMYSPISFTSDEKNNRGAIYLDVSARLRPGVSLANSRAELHTIASDLARAYPDADKGIDLGAIPLQQDIVGDLRAMLIVLWLAVAFMLAVGCANVANLLLTHAAGRQLEFAVRRSLGATNLRLARQLLTESLVLACVGGTLGLAMAFWAVPFMTARLPDRFPRLHDIAVDPLVLWFTAGISLLTGILFGLAPALNSAGRNLAQAIREGGNRGGTGAQGKLGRILIVGEVAVVLVLLVGAGLVVRTLIKLSGVDPGFRAKNLAAWQLFLPPGRYTTVDARRSFYRQVIEQVQAVPGVQDAALAMPLPFGPVPTVLDGSFAVAGRPELSSEQRPVANITRASPSYFDAMGIPLRAGRSFSAADTPTSPAVVIVSEGLARRHFAGQNPLGQHILLGRKQPVPFEIIGVAGDVHHNNLRSAPRPEIYLPMDRAPQRAAAIVFRAAGDPASVLAAVQSRVWSLDPDLAANLAAPVEQLLSDSLAQARIAAVLLGGFALTTLFLGLVGIYGVLSYAVAQRTREIGIRLALGSSRSEVLRLVLRDAARLACAGVALGIVAALALSRYLNALLFQVSPLDPMTYVVVATLLLLAALLAAFTPARRATLVDPAISLRAE